MGRRNLRLPSSGVFVSVFSVRAGPTRSTTAQLTCLAALFKLLSGADMCATSTPGLVRTLALYAGAIHDATPVFYFKVDF